MCQVELSISFDEKTNGLLSFEEIRKIITGDKLTNVMREIISNTIDDDGITITVTKMYGNVNKVGENF